MGDTLESGNSTTKLKIAGHSFTSTVDSLETALYFIKNLVHAWKPPS